MSAEATTPVGSFKVTIGVQAATGTPEEELEAVVDTGSTCLWLAEPLLRRLGYEPVAIRRLTLATGTEVERAIAPVRIRLGSEVWPLPCVFGDDSPPLLGSIALEAFALAVDPLNRRLVPTSSLAAQT